MSTNNGSKERMNQHDHESVMVFDSVNLVEFISRTYPSLYLATVEAIQNGIDSGATRVEVVIDLFAKRKEANRSVTVRDNGIGMSRDGFKAVMARICRSEKSQDKRKLGRHGIGLIAFMGRAGNYCICSGPREGKSTRDWEGYTRHDLAKAFLRDQNELIVPGTHEPELSKSPQWWNTQVEASQFSYDRVSVLLDPLEAEIRSSFNLAMRLNKTELTIIYIDSKGRMTERKIGATHYTGQKFKQHSARGEVCGRVSFDMYRLAKPTGIVTIQSAKDSFGKNWRQLLDLAIADGMDRKKAEALASGFFEGTIVIENCEWDYDRKKFKQKDEAAWLEFLLKLDEWMERDDVVQHLRDTKTQKESEWENGVLKRLLSHFSELQRLDQDLLHDALSHLPGGARRSGNTEGDVAGDGDDAAELSERKAEDGDDEVVSTSTRPPSPRPLPGETVEETRDKPTKGQRGDKGEQKKTRITRDKTSGSRYAEKSQFPLRLCLKSIPGSYDYYEWDLVNGIFVINRDQPFFQSIKESEQKVWDYLVSVVQWGITALPAQLEEPAVQEMMRPALKQMEDQHMRFLIKRISQIKDGKS
jgi:hypothetical protein